VVAIESVLRGQPADKAGLRNGDILVKVNGTTLASLAPTPDQQIDKAGTLIRGEPGGVVTLTVQRGAQPLDLRVTRENLNVPAVYSMRFGRTLYLQVTEFNTDSGKDTAKALSDAIASGAGSVVLDLRDNPGGLVSEAQSIASQFLTPDPSKNEVNVVVRRGRLDQNGDPTSAQRTDSDKITDSGVARSQTLAVLVDANSASASEIVAAALKDYHRGLLFGEKTFGKGSVQEDFSLPDGADLHLTVEKWFGPAGESIDGTGITPDRAVAVPDGDHRFRLDAQAPDPSADPQLQAALKYVQH
jgi:carboxyl-terminal processing protease